MELKHYSNVRCPSCGHETNAEIPESMWLSWIECENCKQKIVGTDNKYGCTCVFCTYGDVPWIQVQERESKK